MKICVSVIPESVGDALNLIKKAEEQHVDFIEVRLDRIKELDKLSIIASHTEIPLIATNRTTSHGGKFSGSEAERRQTLLKAARSGFEYVDLELDMPELEGVIRTVRPTGAKTIISFHDFKTTPNIPTLRKILGEEKAKGADICKIVTMANTPMDNLIILNFLHESCKKFKVVCFAMGALGTPSRLLSPLFGGYFTIAALERGKETAPGQMTIQELKKIYEILRVDEWESPEKQWSSAS